MKNSLKTTLRAVAAAVLCFASCNAFAKTPEAPAAKAEHVVLIALDGFSAQCLREAKPGDYPTMQRMMKEGYWTLKDRSVLPSCSAPNWLAMFTGVPTEIHGFTTWDAARPVVKPQLLNENGVQQTIFSELRRQRPQSRIEVYYEWANIHNLIDFKAVDVDCRAADPHRVDTSVIFAKATASILKNRPALTAVCVDQMDGTGHKYGWMSPQYLAKAKEIDGNIAKLLKAVQSSPMGKSTVFILTSDHGGKGMIHGAATLEEMEIPFVLYGTPVVRHGENKRLMMQYDCAATIAHILGLGIPDYWRGRPVTEAFEKK